MQTAHDIARLERLVMAKTKKTESAPKEPKERPKRAVSKSIQPAKATPKKVGDGPKSTAAGHATSPLSQGSSNAAANAKPKEKPKRSLSAYMHFANAMRSEIIKKGGSNNPAVVMTAAGMVLRLLRRFHCEHSRCGVERVEGQEQVGEARC